MTIDRYPAPTQTRFRAALRSLRVEGIARRVWHAYLAVDRGLRVSTPGDLDYWFPRVREHLPSHPESVLDVGGGDAPYREVLFDATSSYIVLEIDSSRVYPQKGVRYVVGDGLTDMFRPDAFDAIVLTQVLEHVPDPFRLVANCARWLTPGGTIFISVPQYWHVHGWPSDYFRFTRYGLAEIARRSGLTVIDTWAIGGPCMLIYWAIELNFATLMRAPLVRHFIAQPAKLLAAGVDWVLFRDNETRRNPDTQGWIMIARKSVLTPSAIG